MGICMGTHAPHLHRNQWLPRYCRSCRDSGPNSGNQAWQQVSPPTEPTCCPPHIFKRDVFAFGDYNYTISLFPFPPSRFSHLLNILTRWTKKKLNQTDFNLDEMNSEIAWSTEGEWNLAKGKFPGLLKLACLFGRVNRSSEYKDDQRPKLKLLYQKSQPSDPSL